MIKTQVTLWAVGENSFYKAIRFLVAPYIGGVGIGLVFQVRIFE